ncbi:MAG: hypothetical protein N2C14_06945, partial [Planctomycetales bacterium]
KPFDYATPRYPKHLDLSKLRQADATPKNNPLTNAGARLGRVLFYDRQLSRNNTIACASCHLQTKGFADPKRLSVGFQGGHTKRNAMGLANLRYVNVMGHRPGFFWDERAATLETQALAPIQDPVEMGMTLKEVETRLERTPYYPPLFKAAFGSPRATSIRIAKALAQFMRSLESWDAKFDRAAPRGGDYLADFAGFTKEENLGKSIFMNGPDGVAEHGCAHCHVPPTFSMPKAFSNGLDLQYADRGLGALDRRPNDPFTPSDDGKFKASSLRNVELTAPYMHDGRFANLQQVVEHYSSGVRRHENLGLAFEDQEAGQAKLGLHLTAEEQAALVAFLKTLTDRRFTSDPKFSDPFARREPNNE